MQLNTNKNNIISLRNKKANIFNYKNFIDYKTSSCDLIKKINILDNLKSILKFLNNYDILDYNFNYLELYKKNIKKYILNYKKAFKNVMKI